MALMIKMPALSPTMTEGVLAKWLVKEGDEIKSGDVIAEIETDKATMELESADDGVLEKILVQEGEENVEVGSDIAMLREEGEDKIDIKIEKEKNSAAGSNLPGQDKSLKETNNSKENKANESVSEDKNNILSKIPSYSSHLERIFASPLAKRLAEKNNIDLKLLKGSGPKGRVVKKDIENFINNSSNQINFSDIPKTNENKIEDIPVSNMRKTIAQRLTSSMQQSPHFYLTVDCNIDNLLDLRKQINQKYINKAKISVNDLLIKASSLSLIDTPNANVTWHEKFCRYYNFSDISFAVAIDNGLITPVIRSAETKDIFQISNESKELIEKAKSGGLSKNDYEGGSLTISNLGMYDIKNFTAIINPPQSMILAVGSGEKRAVVSENNEINIHTIMTVTLSCDHRVVDGALGAQWLKSFKSYIENPVLMFV